MTRAGYSLLSQFLFVSFAWPSSLHCEHVIYTHIWLRTDCIWITVATKWNWGETFLYKSGAVRSVDWIFNTGVPDWRWRDEYVTLDITFQSFILYNYNRYIYYYYYYYYGRLQDLILLFKILLGTGKNFSKIYGYKQFLVLWTAVAQWLRCCATNRKVAGSIPDGVIGLFHWHNPSDRTMALGSTQPLTEMSTRSISWG